MTNFNGKQQENDDDYDKSLKDFKEEITELKTTIKEAKELDKQQENT